MLRTVCRNITVKLQNNKNIINALDNLENIKLKKYEMSESHTSPFLVYIKDEKKLVTLTEKSLNTQMKNDNIKKIDTNQ